MRVRGWGGYPELVNLTVLDNRTQSLAGPPHELPECFWLGIMKAVREEMGGVTEFRTQN